MSMDKGRGRYNQAGWVVEVRTMNLRETKEMFRSDVPMGKRMKGLKVLG